jgi:2-polyprenyl-6-methoxyphenol hydroxylase-like FAD-dependent oxidoreductase
MTHGASDHTDVLVVGAGPVGLVLAADLLRQGVTVRVVDGASGDSPHSRAIVMWPRTLELLRRLDVPDRLVGRGLKLDAVSFYSDGRRLGAVDICRLPDTPYPFALTIPQTSTEHVLREWFSELGGVVERPVRLTGLDNTAPRPVATLTHQDGSVERVTADWVVGADGARSVVREQLGIDFPAESGEILFAIGDAPVEGQVPNELVYAYRRDGALGVAPMADGSFRIAFSVPRWDDGERPPRELFQRMVDRLAPHPGEVGELRWSTVFRAQRRTAATFRAGSCFLAGDAAHVFSAAGAQGMNTGIQDAVNLSWRLGGVIRGVLDPTVLDGYSAERRRAVERVSVNTQRQTEWGLLGTRTKIIARDALVRAARRTGVLRRYGAPLMSQTDVDYGPPRPFWRRGLRPGMRFPAFAGGGTAWPTADPDTHTLLLWPGHRPDEDWAHHVAAIRAAAGTAVTVRDVSDVRSLGSVLGRRRVGVLVRPDGHVAALLDPIEPVSPARVLCQAGIRLDGPRSAARRVEVLS